jgi:hypothetical protein
MFLKRCLRRKNGKTHTYWALVASDRTARGSRHRVVADLGERAPSAKSGGAQLGRSLDGKRRTRPEPALFDPPHDDEPADDEPVLVTLRDLRLERTRTCGDVGLVWGPGRLLGLDTLLEGFIPAGRAEIPWHQMAALLTIARFCEPSSALHIEDTWYRRTALDDLLGVPPGRSTPTGWTRYWTTSCRTGRHGNTIGSSASAHCLTCSTTGCCTTSPAPPARARLRLTRWPGGRLARPPARLSPGADRPGGHRGGLPAGLPGVRGRPQ